MVATLQSLAGTPGIKDILAKWVLDSPGLVVPDLLVGVGLKDDVKPWDGHNYWTFETWVLAQVIDTFLYGGTVPTETEFLGSLSEATGWSFGVGNSHRSGNHLWGQKRALVLA